MTDNINDEPSEPALNVEDILSGAQNPSQEASADMRQMARMFRDLYVALVGEGFTTMEAMALVGQAMTASITVSLMKGNDEK